MTLNVEIVCALELWLNVADFVDREYGDRAKSTIAADVSPMGQPPHTDNSATSQPCASLEISEGFFLLQFLHR